MYNCYKIAKKLIAFHIIAKIFKIHYTIHDLGTDTLHKYENNVIKFVYLVKRICKYRKMLTLAR